MYAVPTVTWLKNFKILYWVYVDRSVKNLCTQITLLLLDNVRVVSLSVAWSGNREKTWYFPLKKTRNDCKNSEICNFCQLKPFFLVASQSTLMLFEKRQLNAIFHRELIDTGTPDNLAYLLIQITMKIHVIMKIWPSNYYFSLSRSKKKIFRRINFVWNSHSRDWYNESYSCTYDTTHHH